MTAGAETAAADPRANATMTRFGHPQTLVHLTEHWAVLVRPVQTTLGALVLASRSNVGRFGELPVAAFADLGGLVPQLERALGAAFPFEKINYLMLMMVDPQVHFHVFPRRSSRQDFGGRSFVDRSWPGPPDLAPAQAEAPPLLQAIRDRLRDCWPAPATR